MTGEKMAEKKKATRQALSLKRKIEIIDAVESNPKKKRTLIAEDFKIPLSTLSNVVKQKEKYLKEFHSSATDPRHQRNRGPEHQDIDSRLLQWFTHARSEHIPVSGPVLKTKAEEFSATIRLDNWKCSDGWLHRWKKRHNIVFKTVCGERGAVDEEVTDDWVENVLRPTLKKYESRDVFNLDETALFWRLLPDKTFSFKGDQCLGKKKSKERITVMICCNRDGSEKLPLLAIGKFMKPRCLSGVRELPVKYKANPKAWMNSEIFEEWLLSFDKTMQRQNRKALLVLDNCASHKIPVGLRATEVLFLPPNATSKLQPCDTGIIQNLKVKYRTRKVLKLIAHMNTGGTAETYEFTLLDAVCTLQQAWDEVTQVTISNCFRKAGFVNDKATESSADIPEEHCHQDHETQDPLLQRLFEEWDIPPSHYFQIDDDVATMGLSASSTTRPTSSTSPPSADPVDVTDDDGDCGAAKEIVSAGIVLDCMEQISAYCLQSACSETVRRSFHAFRFLLEKHMACAKTQTRIDQFFSKSNASETERTERETGAVNGGKRGETSTEEGRKGETKKEDGEQKGETSADEGVRKGENGAEDGGEEETGAGVRGKNGETSTEFGERKGETSAEFKERKGETSAEFGERKGETSAKDREKKEESSQEDGGESEKTSEEDGGESEKARAEHGGESEKARAENGGESEKPRAEDGGESEKARAEDGGESEKARAEDGGEKGAEYRGKKGETSAEDGGKRGGTGAGEDRDETDTDVRFVRHEQAPPKHFEPTNAAWRRQQSLRLGLPEPLDLPVRHMKKELGKPLKVDTIVGDGNCLYRALSLEICGTQCYHEEIRASIINLMCRNSEAFDAYLGENLGDYLSRNTLEPRSWGSDVEVFAAATLLQTTIVVYTACSETCRKWLSYPPLFPIPATNVCTEKIYIRNLCQHLERVIRVA